MNAVDISVIIPVYNAGPYVEEAIRSVSEQAVASLEVIAVDDGSTDNSIERLESLANPCLKVFRQPHSGAAAARNRGIKEAKGKYLAFIDADDLWAPAKIEMQLNEIRKFNAPDMVFAHVREFLSPDSATTNETSAPFHAVPGYSAITLLISKEKFLQAGWFDPQWKVAEFIDWYDRAKSCGLTHSMLPEVLAYRRIHPGNINKIKRPVSKQYAAVVKVLLDRRRNG